MGERENILLTLIELKRQAKKLHAKYGDKWSDLDPRDDSETLLRNVMAGKVDPEAAKRESIALRRPSPRKLV